MAERLPTLSIKPIQTRYNNYRFRSRLEARWAYFFDLLKLNWVYEPEGFVLPGGAHYLPDFLVVSPQGIKQWYEIKPEHITSDEKFDLFEKALADEYSRACEVDEVNQKPFHAALLSGDPLEWYERQTSRLGTGGVCPRCGALHNEFDYGDPNVTPIDVCVGCWPCDMTTPFGYGHEPEPGVFAPTEPYKGFLIVTRKDWVKTRNTILEAARKARSARFEHGESPAA